MTIAHGLAPIRAVANCQSSAFGNVIAHGGVVEIFQLYASLFCGELPIGFGVIFIADFFPRCNFPHESLFVRNAAVKALFCKSPELAIVSAPERGASSFTNGRVGIKLDWSVMAALQPSPLPSQAARSTPELPAPRAPHGSGQPSHALSACAPSAGWLDAFHGHAVPLLHA
jgi:hypothetical protein